MEYSDYTSSAEEEFIGYHFDLDQYLEDESFSYDYGSISGIEYGVSLHVQGQGSASLGWKSEKNSEPPVAPRKIIKTFTVSDEEHNLEIDVSIYGYLRSFKTEWNKDESNWKCKAEYFWWAEYE